MAQSAPWTRILAEGAVIVASILLALAADAWWEARQLEADVRRELANVREELRSNRQTVHSAVQFDERRATASSAMLSAMEGSPDEAAVSVADTLVWAGAWWIGNLDLPLGALDSFIGSGRLPSVEDAELRQLIAGIRARIDDVNDGYEFINDAFNAQVAPALNSLGFDNLPVLTVMEAFATGTRAQGVPLAYTTHVLYPNRLDLRNLLRERRAVLRGTLPEARLLLTEMDSILASLDS